MSEIETVVPLPEKIDCVDHINDLRLVVDNLSNLQCLIKTAIEQIDPPGRPNVHVFCPTLDLLRVYKNYSDDHIDELKYGLRQFVEWLERGEK